MTRTRTASAAALVLLVGAAFLGSTASAQTPSPSPSGSSVASPSPSGSSVAPPSGASPSPSVAEPREQLAVLLSAEPATVERGAETLLVAQVTNTGNAPAAATSLVVTLPTQLDLVDAFPAPTSTGSSHAFALGPLDPGASAVAQITAAGRTTVEGALVTATAASGSATAAGSVQVSVVERAGAGALAVSSRTRAVLNEVGSMLHYVVTVTNEGDEDLENVLVVDVAPEEVDVFSVDIVDVVEAVQIGESDGRHDIVWNVGSLPAGTSVDLPWEGRAVREGDLKAVNSVRGLVGTTERTRSVSESFLAAKRPSDVQNPPFEPIRKRVVTFEERLVPVATPQPAAAQPGTVLPFTGGSPSGILLAGALLVLGGILLVAGTHLAREPRKAMAAAVLAGLVSVACVSGGDGPAGVAAPPASPRTLGTEEPRRGDGEARVKGERIVRGETATPAATAPAGSPRPAANPPATSDPQATNPPPATPPGAVAPAATPPPAVAAPATAPPAATAPVETTRVRVVRIVRTDLEDLPVEPLGSRSGDNAISFGWDEAAGGITSASSGTRFTGGSDSELLTDLSMERGALSNRMTLRNTAEAKRLSVEGRLVHEVFQGSRRVARLESDRFDLILDPGGKVVARFSYLLPAGDYTVHASFAASE